MKSIAKYLQEKEGILAKLDDEILHKCPIEDITGEVDESTDVSTRINEILAKIDAFERKVRLRLKNEAIAQRSSGRTTTPQGISVLNDQGQAGQASTPQGILEVNAQEQAEQVNTPQGISMVNDQGQASIPQGILEVNAQEQAEQVNTPQGISMLNDQGQASIPQGILEVNAQEQAEQLSTPQGTPVLSAPRQTNQVSTPQGIPLISRFNTSASSKSAQGIKLPKIQLPKFRGEVTKFQAFWQSFKVAVDENESLSMVHKLNYLINSVNRWFTSLLGNLISSQA